MDQRPALFLRAKGVTFAALDRFRAASAPSLSIGRSKKKAFMARVDPVTLDLFRRIKGTIDPAGLMSRGRIFDM